MVSPIAIAGFRGVADWTFVKDAAHFKETK
jgi:hypothetical protein